MHLVTCRDGSESILGTRKMSCYPSVMVSMPGGCAAYFKVKGEEEKKKKTCISIPKRVPSIYNEVAKIFFGSA